MSGITSLSAQDGKVAIGSSGQHVYNSRPNPTVTAPKHIGILDPLRGFAALAVCLYHFAFANSDFLPVNDPVRSLGRFGVLGVHIFFVISGVVIPYSLYLRSYQLADAPAFIIRRLKRVDPPYFASIVLAIGLGYLSTLAPGFRGKPPSITGAQLLSHVAYLTQILGYDWLNEVCWTLAIEFQFYLFIAIAFPLLVAQRSLMRMIATLAIAFAGLLGVGNVALLPVWLPLFAIGIATFQYIVGLLNRKEFLLTLLPACILSYFLVGPNETAAGTLTSLAIIVGRNAKPSLFLMPFSMIGTFSYSLYLIHLPIGNRVVNIASRLPPDLKYRYPGLALAIGVSIVCAYVFWFFVERPSQNWAKKPVREAEVKLPEMSSAN